MDIQEQRQGNAIILKPVGRLDSLSCRDFESRLLSVLKEGSAVIIDGTALDYISSAGLRVLLIAAKQARAAQIPLVLAALRESPREVFEISGFSAIFTIHPTVEAALSAIA